MVVSRSFYAQKESNLEALGDNSDEVHSEFPLLWAFKVSQWWIANGPGHLLSSTTRGLWHHCVARVDVYPSLFTDYKKNIKDNQKKTECVHVKARAVNIWCASYHWSTLVVYAVPCYWFPQFRLGSSKFNSEQREPTSGIQSGTRVRPHGLFWWWFCDGRLLRCASHAAREWL